MRRPKLAGLSLGLLAVGPYAYAQQPQSSPAARISFVQPLQQGSHSSVVARGQAANPAPAPTGMPPGASQSLPTPKSYPNPSVTESRTTPGVGPAAVMGVPIPVGQPYTVGQPYPVGGPIPVGQPYTVGQPIPVGSPVPGAPSVFPGDPMFGPPVPDMEAPLYTEGALTTGPFGLLAGPKRLHLNAEFISWWVRPGTVPALVTSGPAGTTGAINQPGTQVLFGDDFLTSRALLGGRFSGVYWLGANQQWGLDGSVFFLGRNGTQTDFFSGPGGLLARPFFNLNEGGTPFSQLVAAPGLATGAVSINTETSMWGAEANVRRHLLSGPCARLDGFVGFRYLRHTEGLTITEGFTRSPNSDLSIGVPNALFGSVTDSIRTVNNFYAPQIGLTGEARRGRWFVEGRASIAMGTVFQSAILAGAQNIQFDTGAATFPGGLLVLPGANQGTFGTRRFGVMPEVGLKVGMHVTQNLRFSVGYNFLYLNSVLRPGDQIDQGLDVTKIPNFPLPGNPQPIPGRPRVPLTDTDVYAQGISFSMQWFW